MNMTETVTSYKESILKTKAMLGESDQDSLDVIIDILSKYMAFIDIKRLDKEFIEFKHNLKQEKGEIE